MLFTTVALLALAATASAHPHSYKHRHYGHRLTGTGGIVAPTGWPSDEGNSTYEAPQNAPPTDVPVMTVSVVPLPASSDSPNTDASPAWTSAPPMEDVQADSSSDDCDWTSTPGAVWADWTTTMSSVEADATDDSAWTTTMSAWEADATDDCDEGTLTISSTEFITVTVAPTDNYGGTVPPMTSTVAPADHYGGAVPPMTSTVAPADAHAETGPPMSSTTPMTSAAAGNSGPPDYGNGNGNDNNDVNGASSDSSTSTTLSLAAVSSVPAGAFFQHTSASAVPTTFATSKKPSNAPAVSSATSAASSPESTSSPGGSTSGKRGLSYNTASLTDAFAGKGMTWAYNWAAAPGGTILSGLEFVPMLWGLGSTSGWSSAANAAIASGSKHLLSFNEPDLSTQSNISPANAATNHIKYMNPLAGSAQIGSPAVTNGGGTSPPMGTNWLNQFFTACAGQCKVDFVAFHWYDSASNVAYFKSYVQEMISVAAANGVSKVWLTEFGGSGSDSQVESFLATVLPWLDSLDAVERYAYFMCGTGSGQEISGTSLSGIGEAYAA